MCGLFCVAVSPEQRRAPGSDRKQRAKQDDGIDALSTLPRPICHGIEVQPDCELVQREGSADSKGDGKQAAHQNGTSGGAGANLRQFRISGDQQQQNSPDKVVDVTSPHLHVTEGADVVCNGDDQQADAEERNEEADRSQKQPAMRAVWNPLMDQQPQVRQMEHQHDDRGGHRDKDQQDQGAGNMHHTYASY